jgi:hypothetical protein
MFAQLAGAGGGGGDGVDEHGPEPVGLEVGDGGDGGAAGGGDLVAEDGRVLPRLQHELRRPEDGLCRQPEGLRAGEPLLHAAVGERLDDHVDVGRAAPGEAGHRVHEVLRDGLHAADALEERSGEGEVVLGGVAARGEGGRPLVHEGGGVRHGADHRGAPPSGAARASVVTPASTEMRTAPGARWPRRPASTSAAWRGFTASTTTEASATAAALSVPVTIPGKARRARRGPRRSGGSRGPARARPPRRGGARRAGPARCCRPRMRCPRKAPPVPR